MSGESVTKTCKDCVYCFEDRKKERNTFDPVSGLEDPVEIQSRPHEPETRFTAIDLVMPED